MLSVTALLVQADAQVRHGGAHDTLTRLYLTGRVGSVTRYATRHDVRDPVAILDAFQVVRWPPRWSTKSVAASNKTPSATRGHKIDRYEIHGRFSRGLKHLSEVQQAKLTPVFGGRRPGWTS